jgi:hypothetical protein
MSLKSFAQEDHLKHSSMPMKMKKHSYPMSAMDCSDKEVFDVTMSMCMPLPHGMPMKMVMLTGNAFAVGSTSEGPRGRNQIAGPNMFMLDTGATLADRHYINLDFMGTLERWTFPNNGYPELLQIGEKNKNGHAYLDGQHPHSSPIMGLTLSDTISLNNGKDHLKIFASPRGAATDGPIAFMHRPTGITNPDAPLGHHIGQDVGHISSTVIGTSLALKKTQYQFSIFNGTEPKPTKVDLPVSTPNSAAIRIIQEFSEKYFAMASVAHIKNPEGKGQEESGEMKPSSQWRMSASAYSKHQVNPNWSLYSAIIYGHITDYEHASRLSSVAQEFWFKSEQPSFWSRIEFVERTARHLQIPSVSNQDDAKWVSALTLGYTHRLIAFEDGELSVGTSTTKDFIAGEFEDAYAGDPWAAKVFVQFKGMKMWTF